MPIFNAFTKFAVVLSFFEIQTSPICQIKWFYRPVWDLDGEWLHHLPHHLPHVEPLAVHGGVHEVCSNFQNPHPFFPVIYVWGLIWDIVFDFLTTNKETTPNVTPPSKFVVVDIKSDPLFKPHNNTEFSTFWQLLQDIIWIIFIKLSEHQLTDRLWITEILFTNVKCENIFFIIKIFFQWKLSVLEITGIAMISTSKIFSQQLNSVFST